MRVISKDLLFELFTIKDAIEADLQAARGYSAGAASVPLRPTIDTPDGPTLLMPAGVTLEDGSSACGVKIVSVRSGNAAKHLPTVPALHCDVDPITGQGRALIDGTALTYIRTGALSGAAARYLARKDAEVLVVFGGGMQGHAGTEAILAECTTIKKVYICGTSEARNKDFISWASAKFPHVSFLCGACKLADNDTFVALADIILTTTTSATPLFNGASIKPGTFLSCVGSYQPHTREIDTATIKRATVYADTLDGVLHEAGDLIIPIKEGAIESSHVVGELGDLVSGKAKGRTSDDEICLFKTVGSACFDVVVGREIALAAERAGKGQEVAL